MTWKEKLPDAPEDWAAQLVALPQRESSRIAEELATSWARGELEPQLEAGTTADALRPLRHALAAVFVALESQGIEPEVEWWPQTMSTDDARRWCWVTPWLLISQDEDLMLMDRQYAVPLLEEAKAGCPKADYAVGIVEHGVRDQAFHVLANSPQDLRNHLTSLGDVAVAARASGAHALHAYCERLLEYATPSKVDEEGALARAHDLRRCDPGETKKQVKREGRHWHVRLAQPVGTDHWLVVDSSTGAMELRPVNAR